MTVERWNLEITFLTPVHVGSGVTIEPYEYDILSQDGTWFLLVLNHEKMFSSMNDAQRKESNTLLGGDHVDHVGISNWMKKQFKTTQYMKYAIGIHETIGKQLQENMTNSKSRGAIELFTRQPDSGIPYLPGSSIKGSIRTALLNQALGNPIKRELASIRNERELQSAAFEYQKNNRTSLNHDPFRQLSISDANIHPDDCFIHKIEMIRDPKSKKGDNPSGIKICRDMVHGVVSLGENDAPPVCNAQVALQHGLLDKNIMGVDALKQEITPDLIIEACNNFYIQNLKSEVNKYGKTILPIAKDIISSNLSSMNKNQFLIRLGRHSHFENMVMTHHPNMVEPDKGYGGTRSYAGGRFPMGWAICTWNKQ